MSFPDMTSTLCLVEIHRSGVARICNAGHIPPVIAHGFDAWLVEEHGMLLGVQPGDQHPDGERYVPAGRADRPHH